MKNKKHTRNSGNFADGNADNADNDNADNDNADNIDNGDDIDEIIPLDFETAYFFPKIYIFPLSFIADIKAKNLNIDLKAKDIFKENGVFMIKSHGAFAWGKTPLDALRWTLMLEASAKIILSF